MRCRLGTVSGDLWGYITTSLIWLYSLFLEAKKSCPMIGRFGVMTAPRCCAGETHARGSYGAAEAGPITVVSKGRFLNLEDPEKLFLQRT